MFFSKKEFVSITLNGKCFQGSKSKTILDSALENEIGIKYNCGSGTCKQCKFILVSGNVKSKREEMLACQSRPSEDIIISQF